MLIWRERGWCNHSDEGFGIPSSKEQIPGVKATELNRRTGLLCPEPILLPPQDPPAVGPALLGHSPNFAFKGKQ